MIGGIIDALFIALCVVVFGTIIWCNVTEISKARKRLKQHERSQQCGRNN